MGGSGRRERGVFASKLRKERGKKRGWRGEDGDAISSRLDTRLRSTQKRMLKDPEEGKKKKGGLDVMIGYIGGGEKKREKGTFFSCDRLML